MEFSIASVHILLITVFFISLHRYAIHCGLLSEYESIQNKIKNGYLFKVSVHICSLHNVHMFLMSWLANV